MKKTFREKLKKLEIIVEKSPKIDSHLSIPREEFVDRRRKTWKALKEKADIDVAFAFSDEHYSGE